MDRNFALLKCDPQETNGIHVICGEHAANGIMLSLMVRFSLRGRLELLDFGNRSDMYSVAKELRALTRDPIAALENIRLHRAFTCYQALNLLEQSSGRILPLFILDLTAPFLDESIRMREADRLFSKALTLIALSAERRMVFIGVKPISRISSERASFLSKLRETAGDFQLADPIQTHMDSLPDPQASLF